MTATEFLKRKNLNDEIISQKKYVVYREFRLSSLLEDFAERKMEKLQDENEVLENLLQERERLLDAIPECKSHGKCVPHALEWIESKLSKEKEYKSSFRSHQIAKLIHDQFDINLVSAIHRRYTDCDIVKFEMRSVQDENYLFEATVLEFLKPDIEIDLIDNRFKIIQNDYKIQ